MKTIIDILRGLSIIFAFACGVSIHQYFIMDNKTFLPVLIITGIYNIWFFYDLFKLYRMRKNKTINE